MTTICWPKDAPSVEARISYAWDRKWNGEFLDTMLYAILNHIPGPDIDSHPDGDDLGMWGGECFCCDCLSDH